jgi:hypothetical protein
MKFVSIRVYYSYPHNTVIYWEVSNVQGTAKFTIERSLSPQDEFEVVAENVEQHYYVDTIPVVNRNVYFYYRIHGKDDAGEVISEPAALPFPPDPILKSLLKIENHWLRKFIQRPIRIYIKKKYGKRCLYCWDELKQRVTKEKCEYCFGTGFEGGYYPPIDSYMQILPVPKQQVPSPVGIQMPGEVEAWITNYPLVSPGDLISEKAMSYKYKITQVYPTFWKGYIVRQQLRLHIVSLDDIEYEIDKLKIVEELKS